MRMVDEGWKSCVGGRGEGRRDLWANSLRKLCLLATISIAMISWIWAAYASVSKEPNLHLPSLRFRGVKYLGKTGAGRSGIFVQHGIYTYNIGFITDQLKIRKVFSSKILLAPGRNPEGPLADEI